MEGGSANDYDYCAGDPLNCSDFNGDTAYATHKTRYGYARLAVLGEGTHVDKVVLSFQSTANDYNMAPELFLNGRRIYAAEQRRVYGPDIGVYGEVGFITLWKPLFSGDSGIIREINDEVRYSTKKHPSQLCASFVSPYSKNRRQTNYGRSVRRSMDESPRPDVTSSFFSTRLAKVRATSCSGDAVPRHVEEARLGESGCPVSWVSVIQDSPGLSLVLTDCVAYRSYFSVRARVQCSMKGVAPRDFLPYIWSTPTDIADVSDIPPEHFRFGWSAGGGCEASNWDVIDIGTGIAICVPEGGTNSATSACFWCAPIPTEGPLILILEWPAAGIAEQRVDLSHKLVLQASRRSLPLTSE